LLNASVGMQRVLGRLHRPPSQRASIASDVPTRSHAVRRRLRHGVGTIAAASHLLPAGRRTITEARPAAEIPVSKPVVARASKRSLVGRVGHDRVVALAVVGILAGATTVSLSVGHPAVNTGNTDGAGSAPRIAVGGDVAEPAGQTVDTATGSDASGTVAFAAPDPTTATTGGLATLGVGDVAIGDVAPGPDQPAAGATIDVEGPFTQDGTLIKPIAVDTTVRDGSALVKTYTVNGKETLAAIAARFDVSTMSIVWANNLKSKTDNHAGKVLRIPPVTGLIVKVTANDTLEAIAARYNVNGTDIIATNGLDNATLINGQVLVIPGAQGAAIATAVESGRQTPVRTSGGGNGSSVPPPISYTGGKFLWPVVGGGNYISQYFHYGHYAIDIAADYGSTVRAAAAGIVTFAGWKNNGGGYQVWIAHGSGLYTTYNHMSAITVGIGQHLGRGTQVGRIGMTGDATGPHCHFEVWRGPVWNGGTRVNPLAYF
jgi:murein DD-endopeptidase MepM/ murein hydrolase activator NlpD